MQIHTSLADSTVLPNRNRLSCPDLPSGRCPVCGGGSWRFGWPGFRICSLCALASSTCPHPTVQLSDYAVGQGQYEFPNWNNYQHRLFRRRGGEPHWVMFAPGTIRMLAHRDGARVASMSSTLPGSQSVFMPWTRGIALRADIVPWMETKILREPRLTLGVITSRETRADAFDLCRVTAESVGEIIVVLDTDRAALAAAFERELSADVAEAQHVAIRVIARPLRADFAAQRNTVQDAARTDWVLHLDTDEKLTPQTQAQLPAIVAEAEAGRRDGVGLPRRNMVDGELSALYPDEQYRLVRRNVRFTCAVHEYPVLRRPSVHLGSGILHRIDSARLTRRAEIYEAISPGAGRPHDTELLLQRLPPDVRLPFDLLRQAQSTPGDVWPQPVDTPAVINRPVAPAA